MAGSVPREGIIFGMDLYGQQVAIVHRCPFQRGDRRPHRAALRVRKVSFLPVFSAPFFSPLSSFRKCPSEKTRRDQISRSLLRSSYNRSLAGGRRYNRPPSMLSVALFEVVCLLGAFGRSEPSGPCKRASENTRFLFFLFADSMAVNPFKKMYLVCCKNLKTTCLIHLSRDLAPFRYQRSHFWFVKSSNVIIIFVFRT